MFADSLLDSGWEHSSRRSWTTLASFTGQTIGIGILLLVPVIYTQGLPEVARQIETIPVPARQGSPPANPAPHRNVPISNLRAGVLMMPSRIPTHTPQVDDRGIPPADPGLPTVPGSTGAGTDPNGVLGPILGETAHVIVPPRPSVHTSPRVSVMMEGHLIHRVEPLYPALARQAGIQGQVLLQAIIGKDGTIENLRVIGGHPLLVRPAVEAVQQWRYRPYTLNGEPVEVQTQVTVHVVLSGQ